MFHNLVERVQRVLQSWNDDLSLNPKSLHLSSKITSESGHDTFTLQLHHSSADVRSFTAPQMQYVIAEDCHSIHKFVGCCTFLLITQCDRPKHELFDATVWPAVSRKYQSAVTVAQQTLAEQTNLCAASQVCKLPVFLGSDKPDVWQGVQALTRVNACVRYNTLRLNIASCLANQLQLEHFFSKLCQVEDNAAVSETSLSIYPLISSVPIPYCSSAELLKIVGFNSSAVEFSLKIRFSTPDLPVVGVWNELFANYLSRAVFLSSNSQNSVSPTQTLKLDFAAPAKESSVEVERLPPQSDTDIHELSLAALTRAVATDMNRQRFAATFDKVTNSVGQLLFQAVSGQPLPSYDSAKGGPDLAAKSKSPKSLVEKLTEAEPTSVSDNTQSGKYLDLPKGVAGIVPPKTLLYKFASHVLQLCLSDASQLFFVLEREWKILVGELARLWSSSSQTGNDRSPFIPGLSFEEMDECYNLPPKIDYRWCLLHQKLILLNYCLAAKRCRNVYRPPESRLQFDVQLPEVLTEDVRLLRDESLIHKNSKERALLQSNHLQSDMAAFKHAFGAEATFDKFVCWHSPKDWSFNEADGTGKLSARMQAEDSLWQHLWRQAEPLAATDQRKLFDSQTLGDSLVNQLSQLNITELCHLFFPIFLQLFLDSTNLDKSHALEHSSIAAESLLSFRKYLSALNWDRWHSERLAYFQGSIDLKTLQTALPVRSVVSEIASVEAALYFVTYLKNSALFGPFKLEETQVRDLMVKRVTALQGEEQVEQCWQSIVQNPQAAEHYHFMERGGSSIFAALRPSLHESRICVAERESCLYTAK